jgi:hypothetical protein
MGGAGRVAEEVGLYAHVASHVRISDRRDNLNCARIAKDN